MSLPVPAILPLLTVSSLMMATPKTGGRTFYMIVSQDRVPLAVLAKAIAQKGAPGHGSS